MKLSLVATLYQSARHLEEFHRRIGVSAQKLAGDDYEIILVNDGSPDQSMDFALLICEADPHVVLVDLSRNFGHHKAMMAGLKYARGEMIFLIDSDLEEEPEWLVAFAEQLDRDRCDVVYGIQKQRKGGMFERLSGRWFYIAFRALTGLALPENAVTARLMTRRYVDALLCHDEREIMIAGLWFITGFDQHAQPITKKSLSPTTYTLRRKVSILVNSVTSFSNAPLVGIFYSGIFILILAGIYTAYLIFHWLSRATPPSGWTSVMASLWLLGGLIISFIGVVGIYLSKIFSETKRRPNTIIRQVYGPGFKPHSPSR